MPFSLPPTPAENTVVNVTAERKLIFKNGRWTQYINNTIQETVGVPYGSLFNVPTEFPPSQHSHEYADLTGVPDKFTPSAHAHERENRCNFLGAYTAGPGKNLWFPPRDSVLVGIYLTALAVESIPIVVDIVINGSQTPLVTKPSLPANSLRSQRFDFNIPVTMNDNVRIDVISGAGSNLTAVLIYKDTV